MMNLANSQNEVPPSTPDRPLLLPAAEQLCGVGFLIFAGGGSRTPVRLCRSGWTFRHSSGRLGGDGVCPYHGDCLEGLASGLSMQVRWGHKPETLPETHLAWDLEADYIALALVNLIYTYSPRRIVLGGGVAQHPGFHGTVRCKVRQFNQGYMRSPMLLECIEAYIQPPALGNRSGALGAIAMAIELAGEKGKLPVVSSRI